MANQKGYPIRQTDGVSLQIFPRHGPGNQPVEVLVELFRAAPENPHVGGVASGLLKKDRLALVRLHQYDLAIRAQHRDREARKTGSRAYVHDSGRLARET